MSSRFSESIALQASANNDGITSPGQTSGPSKLDVLDHDGYNSAGTFTTVPVWVKSLDAFSVQVSCPSTGSPNFNLTMQVSNDRGAKEGSGVADVTMTDWVNTYWFDRASNTYINTKNINGAFDYLVEEHHCTYRWVRFVFSEVSGSGTFTAFLQQKGAL